VQLKCPICVKESPVNKYIGTISLQVDTEVKVLRPSPGLVEEKFIIHGQAFENERNGSFKIVIFTLVAGANVVEISASLWCELNADFAKLLWPKVR
jgi:hypothetical protein